MSTNDETGPGLEPTTVETYKPIDGVKIGNFKNHPAYLYKTPDHIHLAHVREHLTPGWITDSIIECHGAAWSAGWWHDIKTGKLLDRNAAEMLMLQVSELAEAAHGLDYDLNDDKLPHHKMVAVEIADFLIRLYDYCGGLRLDLQAAVQESEAREEFFIFVQPRQTPALWQTARHVCEAMEGHRKGDVGRQVAALARAHRMIWRFADTQGHPVNVCIAEKMAYNAQRADHKPEARLAPGGKTY